MSTAKKLSFSISIATPKEKPYALDYRARNS
jgi:hypothetical protein